VVVETLAATPRTLSRLGGHRVETGSPPCDALTTRALPRETSPARRVNFFFNFSALELHLVGPLKEKAL
jgi:hypothetical protein